MDKRDERDMEEALKISDAYQSREHADGKFLATIVAALLFVISGLICWFDTGLTQLVAGIAALISSLLFAFFAIWTEKAFKRAEKYFKSENPGAVSLIYGPPSMGSTAFDQETARMVNVARENSDDDTAYPGCWGR
ncbi:MAG: hypothetical protein Q7S01_03415 [bacterium]|nr:hypothetical protein [bacterium]